MRRRTKISLLVIAVTVIVAVAAGVIGFYCSRKGAIQGAVEFGKKYYLSEIRDNVFSDVTINAESYLLLNTDRQTGELHLIGLPGNSLNFIVNQYHETNQGTTFNIEFIYQNQLQILTATSTNNEIRFRQVQSSRVEITQENPEDIRKIDYEVTTMVFTKEVA